MTVISTRDQVPQIIRPAGAVGVARAATAAVGGMSGQDVVRIIRKRKWLIAMSVLICLAAAAGVTAVWWTYFPGYTAFAYLEVRPPERNVGDFSYMGEATDRRKMTMAQTAKQRAVFDKVVADPEVKRTEWWRDHLKDLNRGLESAIDVTPLRETNLLKFSMGGSNPKELAGIVNVWAEKFVSEASESDNRTFKDQIDQIQAEQKGYLDRLENVKREIGQQPHNDDRTIQQDLATRNQEIQILAGEAMRAKLAADDAQRQKDVIDQMDKDGQIENHPTVVQFLDNDGLLRGLHQDRASMSMQRDMLKGRYGNHTRISELDSRIESLEQQIKERETTVRGNAAIIMRQNYAQQVDNLRAMQLAVEARKTQAESEKKVLDATLKTITDLFTTRRTLEEDVRNLDRRIMEIRLLQRAAQPVFLRSPAVTPSQPTSPRWVINLPLGVVVGLLVGFGLTFLLELMDTSIKSPSDVSRRVDLPLLGMVPHLGDLEEEIEDLRLAFMTNPDSLFEEAFRQIRTTLQFSAPAAQLRTLLVTSAMPGDGRSTVSLNLAAATAHSGRKVLVVEANFRQPMLRKLFPQAPEGGLSSVLVGQANWKDLVREVSPNLFVLTGGPQPPNPSELLGSDPMRLLVAELAAEYDQVVFDGAPCVLVTDPTVLSTLVDGVVLVVRATANTYGVVQRARDILGRVGARIFGVVLNGIRVTAGGYLRKNYRSFYEYRAQPEGSQQQLPK